MFLDSTNYRDELERLISDASKIDIAVAFWGTGAENLLIGSGKKIRILCNLTSGGTNPEVIRALQEAGVHVRHSPSLHAKVVLGDSHAILGSANMSSNGLSLEGNELAGWQEAGYVVTSAQDLENARSWFSDRWRDGELVSEPLLKKARAAWAESRGSRVAPRCSLLELPPESLADRGIVVAIWRESPSREALREFGKAEQAEEYKALNGRLGFYEDWKPNSFKVGQLVIDIFVGADGTKVDVTGPWRIIDMVKRPRQSPSNRKGNLMVLHYAVLEDELLGSPAAKALKGVDKRVMQHALKVMPPKSAARVLTLDEFVALL